MRLDQYLVRKGLARSRSQALESIKTGRVLVNNKEITKPAFVISETDSVVADIDHYVARSAHKLLGALAESKVEISGVALDAGASTGGFTQVLLEKGAIKVFALDVGHNQLHQSLRTNTKVVNLEGHNLRDLCLATLGEPVDFIVADVSFISMKLLLKPLFSVLKPSGKAMLMIKPQFEVGRNGLDGRGVVKTEALRQRAIAEVLAALLQLPAEIIWQGDSQLRGPSGNREFFVLATKPDHFPQQ